MNIVALTPAGRFPTVVHDPGQWWSALATTGVYHLSRVSANAAWWQVLCSPAVARRFALSGLRGMAWRARGLDLEASGTRARHSLEMLCEPGTYQSARRYIATVTPLAEHLVALNRVQSELYFSLESGVRVRGLNYDDSRTLVDYARRTTVLSELMAVALATCPAQIGLLVVSVTSPEDLLTGLIAVHRLRRSRAAMHACLADHGYENFSLAPHLERLRSAGTLDSVFDSIIESREDRDAIMPALARAISIGKAPRGYLRTADLPLVQPVMPQPYSAPPPVPTFAGEPIYWARISARRCYWSRCAFCVQNNKYDESRPPSLGEIPAALERLVALVGAGYRSFIFSDEALSPALLEQVCRGILARGLKLRWHCRCKLEKSFDTQLFQLMRAAGCYEVLFGLESISARTLRRMDKHVEGLDAAAIETIFQGLNAAGIGVHVTLIGGFPGETAAEVRATVAFVINSLSKLRNATFRLNAFGLFPATRLMREPSAFGLVPLPVAGDMPSRHPYAVVSELEREAHEISQLLPVLQRHLLRALGWDRLGQGPGAEAARHLYFGSGHGFIFKAQAANAFVNPLNQSIYEEARAWNSFGSPIGSSL